MNVCDNQKLVINCSIIILIFHILKINCNVQVDNATDNHNDNAIFTDQDTNIINIVADLLGVETEKLKQVRRLKLFNLFARKLNSDVLFL